MLKTQKVALQLQNQEGAVAPEQAIPSAPNATTLEICDDFVDDDGDTLIDTDDFGECPLSTGEEGLATEEEGQEFVSPETAMTVQVEICDDFVDDDGDSFADFDDLEDCSPMPVEGNTTAAENMTGEPAVAVAAENTTAPENMTGEPAVAIAAENTTAAENMTGEPAVAVAAENTTAAENMTGEPAVAVAAENTTAA